MTLDHKICEIYNREPLLISFWKQGIYLGIADSIHLTSILIFIFIPHNLTDQIIKIFA